jgi:glucuronoarabinoxylan endo-1,4-beta-xylanase
MRWFTLFGVLLGLAMGQAAQAQTATITWTTTYQTMDGFGGETLNSENSQSMTTAQAAMFYSVSSGIGLTYIRTRNTGDGSIPDLVSLKNAVGNGAIVHLTFQSPPVSLKASGNFNYGPATSNGTCFTTNQSLDTSYAAYATYMVNYIKTLQGSPNNIPIAIVSLQNEPDVTGNSSSESQTYGDCAWSAQAMHDYISGYLGPALSAAGLTPKVMLPELGEWFDQDLATTCLNDPACANYVSIVAGHGYEWSGGDTTTDGYGVSPCCHKATSYSLAGNGNGKHLWLTEINGGPSIVNGYPTYSATMADGLIWAHNIHDYLTVAGVSGWEYWQLTALSSGGDNFGLTDPNFNPAKRYYVVGNWAKFVRPGWVRIASSSNPQSGVFVTAFKNSSSGDFAIIAVNENGSSVNQSFALAGFSSTSLTPWVTSGSLNLSEQSSVTVSNNSLSYQLPAGSVTTFVGTTNGSGTQSTINPPSGLSANVK